MRGRTDAQDWVYAGLRYLLTSPFGLWAHTEHHYTSTPAMHPLHTYIVEDSQVIRDNLIETLEEQAPVQVIGSTA